MEVNGSIIKMLWLQIWRGLLPSEIIYDLNWCNYKTKKQTGKFCADNRSFPHFNEKVYSKYLDMQQLSKMIYSKENKRKHF